MRSIRILLFALLMTCGAAAYSSERTLLVFGDSLSAAYGLRSTDLGWVALLQTRLQKEGYGYRVVNASVSGETTKAGVHGWRVLWNSTNRRWWCSSSAPTTACAGFH